MRNLLAIALCLPLAACVVGSGTEVGDDQGGGGGGGGGGGDGDGTGGGGGGGGGISGKISADTTWSGNVAIGGNVTIDPGVTVTIEAGSTVTVKAGALITVNGIIDAQGTSAGKITMGAAAISVNGELKFSYVTQTGGSITTLGTGKATIVDSHFSRAVGDFLMMSGGTIDMQYSAIGLEPGSADTTHCNMHFGGAGNVIKVTHSNISTAPYGIMFYGGQAADFTYNNWFGNGIHVDTQPGSPVSGNFSNSWFDKNAPTGTGITANNLANARLAACTGANDATCAGPRP